MSGNGTNVTVEDPPPLNLTAKAALYVATSVTSQFRERNAWRPQTSITVMSPNASSYFLGLAIVPIILAASLVVWILLICTVGCFRYKSSALASPQTTPKTRHRVMLVLLFLVFGAALSWAVASGFSLSAAAFQSYISDDLAGLAKLLDDINDRLGRINNSVSLCASFSRGLALTCNTTIPEVDQAVTSLANIARSIDDESTKLFNAVKPFTTQAANGLRQASDVAQLIFVVRTGVISALSLLELILTLIALAFIALAVRGRSSSSPFQTRIRMRRCCLEPSCRCCSGCCTPLLGFLVFNVVLLVIMAAALHALALAIADTCAPNVNVNINRIVGEIENFKPFAAYDGLSTERMCDALNATGSNSVVLSALCYYQTCEPESPVMVSVNNALESFVTRTAGGKNDSQSHVVTISTNSTMAEACEQNLIGVVRSLASTLSNGLWILYYLSCETVNALYARAIYQSVCDAQTAYTVAIFSSWISASIFTMMALLVWLSFAPDLMAPLQHEDEDDGLEKRLITEGPQLGSSAIKLGDDDHAKDLLPPKAIQPPSSTTNKNYVENDGIVGEMDPSSSFLGGPVPSGTNDGPGGNKAKDNDALVLV